MSRPQTASYYTSDDPHHSLLDGSFLVKSTTSPVLSPTSTSPSGRSLSVRKCVIGVCAMDKKTRSKPMTQILDRLRAYGEFTIIVFGDALLLDDNIPIEEWPHCDCLISFTSTGFPLAKVCQYVKLRKPFCVNDVPSQSHLLDRREVYLLLEQAGIPSPPHLIVDRDTYLAANQSNPQPITPENDPVRIEEFGDYIVVNGQRINKPLVEKPVDADDHNIIIYYAASQGGGSRRLFRKVGNRSSRFFPRVNSIRRCGSFVYEELFINGKDLKVYTIGPGYAHGEMRKSPVVDGIVERDPDKKELRLMTKLTEAEKQTAAKICVAFKQNICGFDIIRSQGQSYVIDVNGWSFVKGNQRYFDKCARILRKMCLGCRQGRQALKISDETSIPRHLTRAVSSANSTEPSKEDLKDMKESINKEEASQAGSQPLSPSSSNGQSLMDTGPSLTRAASQSIAALPSPTGNTASPAGPSVQDSSGLSELSPKSLLACISNASFAQPLMPLSLEAPALFNGTLQPTIEINPVPSSNIDVAESVIMDTDNNDVLRALVAVFRHADRTPKQKVKLKTKHPALLALFKLKNQPANTPPPSELKYKKKEDLAELLATVKAMIVKEKVRNKKRARLEREKSLASTPSNAASNGASPSIPKQRANESDEDYDSGSELGEAEALALLDLDEKDEIERAFWKEMLEKERKEREKDPEYLPKLLQVATVLERNYGGIKVQLKAKKVENNRVVQALLVCKWGGEMTHAGVGQARQYAAAFWDDMCPPPPPTPSAFFIHQAAHPATSVPDKPTPLSVNSTSAPPSANCEPSPPVTPVASSTQPTIIRSMSGTSSSLQMKNEKDIVIGPPAHIRQASLREAGIVNTSVSDTVAASAVVNPWLQREMDWYKDKQASFEKQRLDFINGMKVYSSDEARVQASAKAFYLSTMEHANAMRLANATGGEKRSLLAGFKAASEKSIIHDKGVLSYLDDTSMCADQMSRAKEGVKFLLMAENAFTPAQVTRHMLAVEQIARATSDAERDRIEKQEAEEMRKAKEEAEQREQQERRRAAIKQHEQEEQERQALLLDELAQLEEDPRFMTAAQLAAVFAAAPPKPPGGKNKANKASKHGPSHKAKHSHHHAASMMLPGRVRPSEIDASNLSSTDRVRELLETPLQINTDSARATNNNGVAPVSPPPVSPPPSPSSFDPNAMTAWGVRCLRWIGKPRDTLHHLYALLKALQTQIHSKCQFAEKATILQNESALNIRDSNDSTTVVSSPNTRPRRNSLPNATTTKSSSDVFEYVFEDGDEEIVGSKHKFKPTTTRRFAADHLLCHNETLLLLKLRWDSLIAAFYNPITKSFDPTKIPDVYDALKYDVLHNSEFITDCRPLYTAVKRVADFVVPQEYGVLRKDRWAIGVNIAKPLLQKIIGNLQAGLKAKPANRVTLYFSSESHIHALRNVLLLCGVAENRTVATTLDAIELNYLSHAVFRLYEDLSQPINHPLRFYVNVQFSPGAALDPFIFTEADHALPVSRPVPVHGRIPFAIFQSLFSRIDAEEQPYVRPYLNESG